MHKVSLMCATSILMACSHRALPTDQPASETKLLFLVETSSNVGQLDPIDTETGTTRRRMAVEEVVRGLAHDETLSHAIIRFSHEKEQLTRNARGLPGFTRDTEHLETAMGQLDAAAGLADFEGAWLQAFHLLSLDMSLTQDDDIEALRHTHYRVLLLATSSPNPDIQTMADLANVPATVRSELFGVETPTWPYNTTWRILDSVDQVMELASRFSPEDRRKWYEAFSRLPRRDCCFLRGANQRDRRREA